VQYRPSDGEKHILVDRLAARVAVSIDRRAFMRKTAATAFKGFAVLAAGGTLAQVFATPAWAHCGDSCDHRGAGCPTIRGTDGSCRTCGSSRCCSYIRSGKSSSCNCASGTTCRTVTNYCYGKDTRHYASGCWSCNVVQNRVDGCYRVQTITCCDCRTNASRCGDTNISSGQGRCIGTSISLSPIYC
jgi:hypothetical protein